MNPAIQKNLSLYLGASIVGVVVVMAVVSLFWIPHDPVRAVPADRLHGPSAQYWLGTDRFGRDIASRLFVGAQVSLFVGVIAVSISGLLGIPFGVWAAMRGGWTDMVIMRGADLLLAFPALLLAIVAAAVFGPSVLTAMLAIGISGVPGFARVARAGALQVLTQDYISAARISGVPEPVIAWRHIWPNIRAMAIVQASVAFALAILAEATLSFLGLGVSPPHPSWGLMLQAAQTQLGTSPMLAVWPGLAIALTVLGFNLLGDGLRDVLDPRRAAHWRTR
ncbi:ABC transporter permease [Corynebacterium pseudodiphtheriticum]|uniref:ABC transporter permease n=1 Tax=Corynebacterium pseudodiphtheriticum TaxID=37637 RepID=UPI00254CCE9F|nr:ABC transporter permease [Corynebacterium pseudodiphtheriticum]MDK8577288.1 ABC transporter permease [Corynebacterium pseudodiphtheriticum]MDK8773872.1 ABC transporter permease [Corynebacterium pseudodiphtheriticum]